MYSREITGVTDRTGNADFYTTLTRPIRHKAIDPMAEDAVHQRVRAFAPPTRLPASTHRQTTEIHGVACSITPSPDFSPCSKAVGWRSDR